MLVANADSRVDRQVTASMIFEAYRKEIYALAVVSIGSTAVFIGLLLKKNHQLRKDIAEIKERDEKIEYLTYHDKLTGLYNRTYLDGVIENIEAKNQVPTSVLLGDVNGLKLVNDVLGHAAGDLLLQGIARLLQQYCRPEDIIARQGGDEYVVVMPKTSKEEAARIHRSILDACEQHCVGLLPVHLSLGYGTKEKRRDSIRKALGDAERMMYEQKLMSSISQSNGVVENLEKYLEEKDPVAKQHGLRLRCRDGFDVVISPSDEAGNPRQRVRFIVDQYADHFSRILYRIHRITPLSYLRLCRRRESWAAPGYAGRWRSRSTPALLLRALCGNTLRTLRAWMLRTP